MWAGEPQENGRRCLIGIAGGDSSVAMGGRDVEDGMTERRGGIAGAADVAGFGIGSGLVDPPEAGETLSIYVSIETRGTSSRRTLSLVCEWQGIGA